MSYSPIGFIAPNYRDYKTDWLKAYKPGTTTPKPIAIGPGAPTLVEKLQLNADGFIVSAGGAIVMPYIDGAYDMWLFPTEAEADANDTSNAQRVADNLNPSSDETGNQFVSVDETQTLTAGQTAINLAFVDALTGVFYIADAGVDRGRLIVDIDYTVTSSGLINVIELINSFPNGAVLTASSVALVSSDLVNNLSQAYEFPTTAAYKAFSLAFPVGKVINLLDRGARFTVISGTGTSNGDGVIASDKVSQSISIVDINDIDGQGLDSSDETTLLQRQLDNVSATDVISKRVTQAGELIVGGNNEISIGEIQSTTADRSTFNVLDSVVTNEVFGVIVRDTKFSGATGVDDNFAYISTFNAINPLIENIFADGGRTAVRLGYQPLGVQTTDAFLANLNAKGCESFGVEFIESDRTLANNLNIGNDGVQIGSHALRFTGTDTGVTGNVVYGFSARDRLTTGLSIQLGASHNIHGLGIIENVGESGVQANTASVIDAKSMIPHAIIKDPASDGLNLSNLSHMFFDSIVDNPAQKGLRIGGGVLPSDEGVNMGRVLVINPANGGATIASDHNMIDIIVDNSSVSGAIVISGNENIVRIISKLSATLTVYITGNKNSVTMIEDGTGAVGLRVDGDQNVVDGIVTSQTSINGDNNYINALTIGGVTDSGAGNTKPTRQAL